MFNMYFISRFYYNFIDFDESIGAVLLYGSKITFRKLQASIYFEYLLD
jgi:hypothetical protein